MGDTSPPPGRTALGTDVVILNASNGNELLRLTDDDASWAPSWSPAGDSIAFLHIEGQTVDLRLAKLDGTRPGLDRGRDGEPDRGVRARCRLATGLVHPAGPAAAAGRRDRGALGCQPLALTRGR